MDILNDDHTNIHEINRANLLDDLASFVKYDFANYEIFLDMLMYLEKEESYLVWSSVSEHINGIYNVLRGFDTFDKFDTFVRSITEIRYDFELTNFTINHFDRLYEENIAYFACYSGVESCVNESTSFTDEIVSS